MNEYSPKHRRGTAIRELAGPCAYDEDNGVIIKWRTPEGGQPSEADIEAKVAEYAAEWDSQEYARNRAEQYPDLAEQLDLLWHAIDTDTLNDKDYRNKFYTRLKKVKEDNPKG